MAPTVSFWDTGEFIATSHIMGIPHPPGSPLFLLLGKIFSLIPFSKDIAFRVNLLSVISSAKTTARLLISAEACGTNLAENSDALEMHIL